MNNLILDTKSFLEKRKLYIIIMIIILAIAFGFELTNFTLSNDEELYINSTRGLVAWIEDGRFGVALINGVLLLFGMFGPFLSTFLAILLLFMSSIIWCLCFQKICDDEDIPSIIYIIFSGFYCTVPLVVTEYMVYSTINIQMSLGMLLIAIADYSIIAISKVGVNKKKYIIPILITTFSLSIYQGLTSYYISGASILILLQIIKSRTTTIRNYLKLVFTYISIFIISIIIYFIICKLSYIIYPKREYLSSLSQNQPIVDVIKYIFDRFIYGSGGIYFTVLKLTFFMLLILGIMIIKGNSLNLILESYITMLVGIFAPYSVFIVLRSTNIQFRSLTGLLIYVGGIWFVSLFYIYTNYKSFKHWIVYTISLIIIFYQCQMTNQLFYGDYIRYQNDLRTADNIMLDVSKSCSNYTEKTLVFSGGRKIPESRAIPRIQVIGMSIFEWEGGNNYRIIPFINSMGYDFHAPTEEQIKKANEISKELSVWPEEGSIIEEENMIIVKLSNVK